jgi:hypothetical protein
MQQIMDRVGVAAPLHRGAAGRFARVRAIVAMRCAIE